MAEQKSEHGSFTWLGQAWQDVRFGLRQLTKAPGFAAVAILTVAIGIGASTSLFSIVSCVLLRPVGYDNAEELVYVTENWLPKVKVMSTSAAAYTEFVEQASLFSTLAAISWERAILTDGDRVAEVPTLRVTANYFTMMRLRPEMGRLFLPEEMRPGREFATVLSYETWQSRYGGRANILGEKIQLGEQMFTVVGVVRDKENPRLIYYLPLVVAGQAQDFGARRLFPSGRLRPGVTVQQAQKEMDVIGRRLAQEHPDSWKDHGVTVLSYFDARVPASLRVQLYLLLGAVGFLFLIACVNVTSLLLARANSRQREIAVRTALGAGRGRIVRQFLCESMLIAVIGGVVGTGFAFIAIGPLGVLARYFIPGRARPVVDGTVLGVTCGLMLLAGLGLGLVPALQSVKGDMQEAMKDGSQNASGGRRRQRLQSILVVVETSLALVLLACTGLLVRSLWNLQTFDQGLRTERVYNHSIFFNSRKKYDTAEKTLLFTRPVLERLQSLPEIECASFTSAIPMDNGHPARRRPLLKKGSAAAGSKADEITTETISITPDYLRVMSIRLLSGRAFTTQDRAGAPRVALVNQEVVRRYFPNEDPIGQQIRLVGAPHDPEVWSEIVGVVGNVKSFGPMSETQLQVYEPLEQAPDKQLTLMLRTVGKAPGIATAVCDIIHAVDSDIEIKTLFDYEGTISYAWRRHRLNVILFSIFSGIALLLAAVGIYGVIAYSVGQRTQEIGIRMALGALPGDVLRLVLTGGAKVVGLGLLVGLGGALACSRVLSFLLFNTSPYDPLTLGTIIVLLAGVALLACWIPARRATKVNPLVALRHE